jgi:myb proto-oncogene protein
VWHTHIKKRLEGDAEANAAAGGRPKQQKARKSKPAAAAKKATASMSAVSDSSEQQPFTTASPGLSSSVSSGVTTTFSAATESTAAVSSGDNAATTSASPPPGAAKAEMEMESFSSAEFPPIDESFWSSPDVVDMGLGAMDEELGLAGPPSLSTRDEDMEFWLKMLLEAGDMRDLSVL